MICLVSLVTGLIDQPTGHMQRPDGRKWRSQSARSQGRRGPWLLTVQICSVSNPLGQRPKLTFLLSLFLFCLGKVPAYSPGGKSGGQNKFERAAGGENLNFIFPFDIFGASSKWVCRQYHSRFNLEHTAKMPYSKIHICSKRRGIVLPSLRPYMMPSYTKRSEQGGGEEEERGGGLKIHTVYYTGGNDVNWSGDGGRSKISSVQKSQFGQMTRCDWTAPCHWFALIMFYFLLMFKYLCTLLPNWFGIFSGGHNAG